MPTTGADFIQLAHQLDDITQQDGLRYATFRVHGHTFAYYWPATQTVGLKQLVAEQLALVAERPEVFEIQFTAGGFGWIVVRLERIDRGELAELTFEAWRLTAPTALVEARGDVLPR